MSFYYLDTSAGSDGTGTEASPFNAKASAEAAVAAGDTLFIKAGTTVSLAGGGFDFRGLGLVRVAKYSTGAHPILDCQSTAGVKALQLEGELCSVYRLRFTGSVAEVSGGGELDVGKSHRFEVRECEFTAGLGPAIAAAAPIDDPNGIGLLDGRPVNRIIGCYFFSRFGDCFTQIGNSSWEIAFNRATSIGDPAGTTPLTDVFAAHNAYGALFSVHHNRIQTVHGKSGIQIQDASAVIYQNEVFDVLGTLGAIITKASDAVPPGVDAGLKRPMVGTSDATFPGATTGNIQFVFANLVNVPAGAGADTFGIGVWIKGNAYIWNNTVVNRSSLKAVSYGLRGAGRLSFNVSLATHAAAKHLGAYDDIVLSSVAHPVIVDTNVYWPNDDAAADGGRFRIDAVPAAQGYFSLAGIQAIFGGLLDNEVAVDPMLLGSGTYSSWRDFRPAPGSPVAGMGQAREGVHVDFRGQPFSATAREVGGLAIEVEAGRGIAVPRVRTIA